MLENNSQETKIDLSWYKIKFKIFNSLDKSGRSLMI
jgi:hypothetical protein